jgi:hypothetical protein
VPGIDAHDKSLQKVPGVGVDQSRERFIREQPGLAKPVSRFLEAASELPKLLL